MPRLNVAVMRELLSEIAVGDFAAGQMLPREVDLVERFGVSRGVVRECIRGLEERGVVSVTHGRGARVNDSSRWDVLDPEVLSALLDAPGGDELVHEARECQRLLEVEAAGLAAEHAGRGELEAVTAAVDRMAAEAERAGRSASAIRRYHDADIDFHRAVVEASGNRVLARMCEPLHRALLTAAQERAELPNVKRRLTEHRKILAAIADGDPAAARSAMDAHLGTGRRRRARQAASGR